ncbi:MAG: putative cysteine desulfurase [Chlamydiae bacterium]|nr:putative cysteine desulfurase [Chlamydiota bacterium]
MTTSLDLRSDFPILERRIQGHPLVYFDSAATTLKPTPVIEAISHFYTYSSGPVHRGVYTLSREATDQYEAARRKVQHFIGADSPEEIIFTRGTTASLNLLAHSFGQAFLRPGDVVLLSEIEHHSNLVPWQMLAERRGVVLRYIPVNDAGELIIDEFFNLLDRKVKLISLAHISNVLGTLHPVKTLIEAAHRMGAFVCLDGAQSAPHLPLDVQELDVDFYAFSGHKLYGPTGIGVLYGKRDLLSQMPPIEGGGDMIEQVTLEKTTYAPLPFKFEAGTPMVAQAIGLGAAIDYVETIGMEKIAAYEAKLLNYATNRLSAVPGVKLIGTARKKGAIISFVIDGTHPLDLATLLDCRGIAVRTGHHCSQPTMERFGLSHTARLSFGIYNTLEEIDTLISTLKSLLPLVRRA